MPTFSLDLSVLPAPARKLARALACAAALAAAPLANALDGPTAAQIRATGVVRIAHRDSAIPFAYVVAGGHPVGYAIDLCARVIDALRTELRMPDLKVRYVPVTAATRIPTIAEGKADMECGSTTNTASRRRKVAFSVVHFFAAGKILARTDTGVRSPFYLLADANRTVVVTRGSSYAARLHDQKTIGLLRANLREVESINDGFGLVEAGKVDGFLHDDVGLFALRGTSPQAERLQVLADPLSLELEAVVLRKDDPAFKRFVDKVISGLMIDGHGEELYRKWFQSPIPPHGVNLQLPLTHLMRDQMNFPSDKVGDEVS